MYKNFVKRIIDICFSMLLLCVFTPLFLFIAALVFCTSKGPVFFLQERYGRNNKVFKIIKFRSMVVGAEREGVYSNKDDKRVTKIGGFLRKTSLDELPQLINVLVGEMSFIGPRPPLTYHPWKIEEYTIEQKRMFDVRPGITGWAQVHGRKEVEWHKRIDMNVWYVDNISFWLDIKIFILTIIKVFSNEGNANCGATIEKVE